MEDTTWNIQYNEEKDDWMDLVKHFIDTANGKRDAYKEIENYEFLRYFNFDILNLNYSIDNNHFNILSSKAHVSISNLKKILSFKKLYIGDDTDPDNMQIVRAILLLIFDEEKLKQIYQEFYAKHISSLNKIEELLPKIIENEVGLKKEKKKQYLIKETISLYKKINNPYMLRPDTTNSYNSRADKHYGFVFSAKYLELYNKLEFDELKKFERDFYYDYHTLPNFCILPNETLVADLQRYIKWIEGRINGNNPRKEKSDSINTYRGLCGLGIRSKFGKDNFYTYLYLLKRIWNCFDACNNNDKMICEMKKMGIESEKAGKLADLFFNNAYFYKAFNSFDEYCDKMMIDYSLYENREKSDMNSKKAFYYYNKIILDRRWNLIKDKLFQVLNE